MEGGGIKAAEGIPGVFNDGHKVAGVSNYDGQD